MKLVYSHLQSMPKSKKIPLYKDRKAIAVGVIKWTLENNERVRKLKAQSELKGKS